MPASPPHLSFPRRLRIGAKEYTVTAEELKHSAGDMDGGTCKIRISPDQSPAQVADTYLHEILHMLVYESGLYALLENPPAKYKGLEEVVVRQLATHLLALLRDNTKVLDYLKRMLK